MIKIEHTVFALPFALIGMMLAAGGWPAWGVVGWILVAMVGARSAAMGFNRWADRHLDAANPRTADRALPAGEVSSGFVVGFVVASCALLVLAAWKLNPLALRLSPVAILIILGYSYTKRFTALAHLFLGLAISGAPLGAWIAVRGEISITPVALATAVLLWVAGFDVLYALQDLDHDRKAGLHSIPARLGVTGALWVSGLLHLGMVVLLALLPVLYRPIVGQPALGQAALDTQGLFPPGLGPAYVAGVLGCAILLGYQHWILRPSDLSRLNAAFFQANGLLALWLLLATAVDLLLLH